MFTGIIQTIGRVRELMKDHIIIEAPDLTPKLKKGTSIAVDGACLSVTDVNDDIFRVEFMPETVEKTIIAMRNSGDMLNLELATPADGRFEGHIVTGHVEGIGEITSIKKDGNAKLITVRIPEDLELYVVTKGWIAVNGISLTVINIEGSDVIVGIIPLTWQSTNLQNLSVGDRVNIETDLIGKYIKKLTINN